MAIKQAKSQPARSTTSRSTTSRSISSRSITSRSRNSDTSRKHSPKKKESFWLSLLTVLVVSLVLRSSLVEAFTIPTGSMKNTVLVGDYIFVNKLSYFLGTPKYIPFTSIEIPRVRLKTWSIDRGDVIVFEYPGDRDLVEPREKNVNYIKRCIGLPGDTVQVINRQAYVNGKPAPNPDGMVYAAPPMPKDVPEPQIFPRGSNWNPDWYGPLRIPKAGDVIKLTKQNFSGWQVFIEREKHTAELTATGEIMIDGKPTDHYTVQRDYLFMMGDNREQSEDSRFWGFAPVDNVVGKAMMVYWSRYNPPAAGQGDGYDPDEMQDPHMRWDRIGTLVR